MITIAHPEQSSGGLIICMITRTSSAGMSGFIIKATFSTFSVISCFLDRSMDGCMESKPSHLWWPISCGYKSISYETKGNRFYTSPMTSVSLSLYCLLIDYHYYCICVGTVFGINIVSTKQSCLKFSHFTYISNSTSPCTRFYENLTALSLSIRCCPVKWCPVCVVQGIHIPSISQ